MERLEKDNDMHENFDYEEVFMGVVPDKPKDYIRSFREDYRLKRLTEAVSLAKGRLLDIGCAGGILTESLPHYFPHVEVYGCDISNTAISYARKLGSGKVTYAVIKNKRLPYQNSFFDVCICLDVMEHVPDIDFFLKEVKRILKKDGKFFLLVPCEEQPFTYTWLFQKLKILDKATFKHWGHIHPEFTHKSVEKLLVGYGFTIRRKTYSEHVLWQLVSVLIYFLPHELMRLFLGKRASEYSDSGVIRAKDQGKKQNRFIIALRNVWYGINRMLRWLTSWETEAFKHIPFTAWKIHILAQAKKG